VRVLVTGGAGFVGARLRARLSAEGVEVHAPPQSELDVADGAALRAAVARVRPHAVAHLAALSFVPAAEADPAAAFRVNFLGVRAVLEALRGEAPAARALIVSSAAVYGSSARRFDESAPLRPEGAYARSKAAADLLAGRYAELGLNVVRARPFNHTGAGRPAHFVESSLARQLAAAERAAQRAETSAPLRIGNPDSMRDILHVEDVVEAYWRLLQPSTPPGVYNIASGRGVSIRELLELLLARTALRPRMETERGRWRPADALVGDARRLRDATGWQPQRSLPDALAELLDYWRHADAK